MSPLSTPSQQGYHVQTVKPLTFILQLPNSSVLNLNLNSLLVKRQIDNPSPGAVTGRN